MEKKLSKKALRAGVVTAGTATMLLMSTPAFAVIQDNGNDPGKGLSVVQTLGLFVAIPLVLFGIIAGLVMATDKSRKQQSS